MISGKKILITGGAGFIGSNLARRLSESGNELVIVDDLSEGHESNMKGLQEVRFFKEDIRNYDFMRELVSRNDFDFVFHFAASFANQKSVDFPAQDLEINGEATLKLLENLKGKKLERFVYISSSCIYGAVNEAMKEELKPAPETPYAITKLLGEHYIHFYNDFHKLPSTVIRYFNVYGPNEFPGLYRNVVPNFFAMTMQGSALPITGTGDETRDFTFVDDAVQGTLLAAERKEGIGQAFNLGSGKETRIIELSNLINEISGSNKGVEFKPKRNWDHISRRFADIGKAKKRLGYEPKVNLKEGLKFTYYWLKENYVP